jgi:predicted DNA-binding protein
MSKDTQLNIRVEKDLVERLKAQAEIEVTTPSQLVRKAVTLYLREATADA